MTQTATPKTLGAASSGDRVEREPPDREDKIGIREESIQINTPAVRRGRQVGKLFAIGRVMPNKFKVL